MPGTSEALNLGFLTVLHEASGYMGGYLVTNRWGRPLEFRLSSAVQPNRVQQILYGGSLQPYICADLIGKTLVEKTASRANLIVCDREPLLDLRQHVNVPVLWLPGEGERVPEALAAARLKNTDPPAFRHPRFDADAAAIREYLDVLDGADLAEPFTRVREAINEARKFGVSSRTA